MLQEDQLVEPRIYRLRHIPQGSQTEFSYIGKVLILVVHDKNSRGYTSNQIYSSEDCPVYVTVPVETEAQIFSTRTLLGNEIHVDQNHDHCGQETCWAPTARANDVLDVV